MSSEVENPGLTDALRRIEAAQRCLRAFGRLYEKQDIGFVGRELRGDMRVIEDVLQGNTSYTEFCDVVGIDPGSWTKLA